MAEAHVLGILQRNKAGTYELVDIRVYSEGIGTITHTGNGNVYAELMRPITANTFGEALEHAQNRFQQFYPELSHLFAWKHGRRY